MRHVLAAVSLLVILAACSGDEEDECPIVGTYSVTGASESGNCPDSVNETTIYTVSADGDGFAVEIQGVQGFCDAQRVSTCKIQGRCDVGVKDPRDPANARGTLQFSWTFDPNGFKGTLAVSVPDALSLPGGCTGTNVQTGVRR